MSQAQKTPAVVLEDKDFPAFCPNPRMPVWSSHPKVYLDLSHKAEAACPYCGTTYKTADGHPHGGH